VADFDDLLALQDHDLALDRLRHRRATLPERDQIAALESTVTRVEAELATLRRDLAAVAGEERRFEDEARSAAQHAADLDAKLYSGVITAPKELQALQADVEQVRRRQSTVEDHQLAAMERREPLEAQVAERDATLATTSVQLVAVRDALAVAEAAIDAEAAIELAGRQALAAALDPALLADYERCRVNTKGAGAARLVGTTCQGCHLVIPSTEVAEIRKAPAGTISHCDNCGCILVLDSTRADVPAGRDAGERL
jgi:predicted  nucleic acid-binding Zn-ribbon protein